jgi:hypothetical protein
MSDYYVIAFTHENPLAQNNKFHHEGVRLIKESVQRIPRGLSKEQAQGLECAIVYTLLALPPHLKEQLQNAKIEAQDSEQTWQREMIGVMLNPPVEYRQYDQVHFLNEVALRMYKEGGTNLEILKIISEDELPEGSNRSLRGPYIPK